MLRGTTEASQCVSITVFGVLRMFSLWQRPRVQQLQCLMAFTLRVASWCNSQPERNVDNPSEIACIAEQHVNLADQYTAADVATFT